MNKSLAERRRNKKKQIATFPFLRDKEEFLFPLFKIANFVLTEEDALTLDDLSSDVRHLTNLIYTVVVDNKIAYVGKTAMTFGKRWIRNDLVYHQTYENIVEEINKGKEVEIYACTHEGRVNHMDNLNKSLVVELAASTSGVESYLINYCNTYKYGWNAQK